jgi:hypothetical protein
MDTFCTNVYSIGLISVMNSIGGNNSIFIINFDGLSESQLANLTITSPTSGGRSVGIVRSRTQTMEFV